MHIIGIVLTMIKIICNTDDTLNFYICFLHFYIKEYHILYSNFPNHQFFPSLYLIFFTFKNRLRAFSVPEDNLSPVQLDLFKGNQFQQVVYTSPYRDEDRMNTFHGGGEGLNLF